MSEVERPKQTDDDDRWEPTGIPDGPLAVILYFGWVCVSLAIGVGLIESGPPGLARFLFAVGVTIILGGLPLVWGKGWTED